jgi:hypothetical protein
VLRPGNRFGCCRIGQSVKGCGWRFKLADEQDRERAWHFRDLSLCQDRRMNAIEKIKAKLSAYPDVQYSDSADEIEVHPRDQSEFTIGLRITPSGFTVHFEG